MLLYFRSADLHYSEADAFCQAIRRNGQILCLPNSDTSPQALAGLPFTAAIYHFHRSADGLPHPQALRECFPQLPIIAVGDPVRDTQTWRVIPETDYEFFGDQLKPENILALTAHLRQTQAKPCLHRANLHLTEDRHRTTVIADRVSFTPSEYTIIRVCAAAQEPLPAEDLSGFLARPGSRHSIAAISSHVRNINRKVAACGAPRLIRCRREAGYLLCPPYDQILPQEHLHIFERSGNDNAERM
ncbi:MAG: hypothetical protein IKD37_05540 [Clostridia bacterium]|nr:hypothetical protein [Clostridia bacterium]